MFLWRQKYKYSATVFVTVIPHYTLHSMQTALPELFTKDFATAVHNLPAGAIQQAIEEVERGLALEVTWCSYHIATAIEALAALRHVPCSGTHSREEMNTFTAAEFSTLECYLEDTIVKQVQALTKSFKPASRLLGQNYAAQQTLRFRTMLSKMLFDPATKRTIYKESAITAEQTHDLHRSQLLVPILKTFGAVEASTNIVFQDDVAEVKRILELADVDGDVLDSDEEEDESECGAESEDEEEPSPKRLCIEDDSDSEASPGNSPRRVPATKQRIGTESELKRGTVVTLRDMVLTNVYFD